MNDKVRIVWIPGWACGRHAIQPLIDTIEGNFEHEIIHWKDCLRDWNETWSVENTGHSDLPGAILKIMAEARGPVILAGWSLGGMLALRAAIARPEAVKALVLIASTAQFINQANHPGTAAKIRAMRHKIQRESGLKEVLHDFFFASKLPAHEAQWASTLIEQAVGTFTVDELSDGLDYLGSENLPLHFNPVQIPCLKVHGANDRIISLLNTSMDDVYFKDLTTWSIPDQGHMLPLTATKELSEMISNFLEKKCS